MGIDIFNIDLFPIELDSFKKALWSVIFFETTQTSRRLIKLSINDENRLTNSSNLVERTSGNREPI